MVFRLRERRVLLFKFDLDPDFTEAADLEETLSRHLVGKTIASVSSNAVGFLEDRSLFVSDGLFKATFFGCSRVKQNPVLEVKKVRVEDDFAGWRVAMYTDSTVLTLIAPKTDEAELCFGSTNEFIKEKA